MAKSNISPSKKIEPDDIGARIKSCRNTRGFTLVELGERSGVSKAAISKIERGEISPTYSTLRKIALALNETIASLTSSKMEDPNSDIEIVRAGEGQLFGEDQSAYRLLAGKAISETVRCFISDVPAGSDPRTNDLHTHNTEEIVYVLQGHVLCQLEGRDPIELQTGDSLYFRGDIPHAFSQIEEAVTEHDPARLLWISMPR